MTLESAALSNAKGMEGHLRQLETQGYTVVPAAIPSEQLARIRDAYDRVCEAIRATKPKDAWCLVKCMPECAPPRCR